MRISAVAFDQTSDNSAATHYYASLRLVVVGANSRADASLGPGYCIARLRRSAAHRVVNSNTAAL